MLLFYLKALLSQWKLRDAAVKFDTYRSLQRHRAVFPAIARYLVYLLTIRQRRRLRLWSAEDDWILHSLTEIDTQTTFTVHVWNEQLTNIIPESHALTKLYKTFTRIQVNLHKKLARKCFYYASRGDATVCLLSVRLSVCP